MPQIAHPDTKCCGSLAILARLQTVWACLFALAGCSGSPSQPQADLRYNYGPSSYAPRPDTENFQGQISALQGQIGSLQGQLNSLQTQIEQIRQKTDNICFQDQMGLTVIRPCGGE